MKNTQNTFCRNALFALLVCLVSVFSASGQGWQWGRGNTGSGMDGWPVATDQSGNVFIAALNFGSQPADFGGGIITPDLGGLQSTVVAKYDGSGNVIWARETKNTGTFPVNIATDPSGNVYLLGIFFGGTLLIDTFHLNFSASSFAASMQYFLVKYDPNGNVLWAKTSGGCASDISILYSAYFLAYGGIATDATGNVFITGNYSTPTNQIEGITLTNHGPIDSSDIFVAKYNSSGDLLWATGIGGYSNDVSLGIAVSSTGNVYITGNFESKIMKVGNSTISSPAGLQMAFVAELSGDGAPLWAQASTNNGFISTGVGITSDNSGNIYVTGAFDGSDIKFDTTTIHRTYPYPGTTTLSLFLIQLSTENKVTWSKVICSPNMSVVGFCIALAACGEVWVSGTWNGELNVNSYHHQDSVYIDGHILYTPDSSYDAVFIVGYNLSGGVIGYDALQSGADDQNGIACDPAGNVYMCADYYSIGFCYFNVGPNKLPPSNGTEYFYLAKYKNQPTVVIDTSFGSGDTSFCKGTQFLVNPPPGYFGFLWSTGSTDHVLRVDDTGTYWVACEAGCAAAVFIDTIHVSAINCDCFSDIPTAFTPNNDGRNDGFKPLIQSECKFDDYRFSVYNRWGERVFMTENPAERWNGEYHGIPVELGVYMYDVTYTNVLNKKKLFYKGDVTLIR